MRLKFINRHLGHLLLVVLLGVLKDDNLPDSMQQIKQILDYGFWVGRFRKLNINQTNPNLTLALKYFLDGYLETQSSRSLCLNSQIIKAIESAKGLFTKIKSKSYPR